MNRREPPKPPSTDPADLFRIRPHVEREIAARLKENNQTGYRDRRRAQPDLTPTEKVQVKAGLVAAKHAYLDRPRYTVYLAREVAYLTQVVSAPLIDRKTADSIDALRQPEGREFWRRWRDPLARSDRLPTVAAAKTLAVMMVVGATVYVKQAYNDLCDSLGTQALFNCLEEEVNGDAV